MVEIDQCLSQVLHWNILVHLPKAYINRRAAIKLKDRLELD